MRPTIKIRKAARGGGFLWVFVISNEASRDIIWVEISGEVRNLLLRE